MFLLQSVLEKKAQISARAHAHEEENNDNIKTVGSVVQTTTLAARKAMG